MLIALVVAVWTLFSLPPALREAAFALMQLKTEQWQLELAWGQSLHAQILSRLKQHEGTTAAAAVEGSPASQN